MLPLYHWHSQWFLYNKKQRKNFRCFLFFHAKAIKRKYYQIAAHNRPQSPSLTFQQNVCRKIEFTAQHCIHF